MSHFAARAPRRRRRAVICALLAFSAVLCGGCAYVDLLRHSYAAEAPPAQRFHFRDGGEAIYFTLEKGVTAAPGAPETYLFVFGGSGCTSMKYWLPRYFDGLEGLSGRIRIFAFHKRFIGERSWGRLLGCGADFLRFDHPRQWIADYTEFIEATLAARTPPRVVLVGISEGAEVVPALARRISGVTHVALIASAGMDPMEAYSMQLKRFHLERERNALDVLQREPPSDPDAIVEGMGGRTWRYWAELRDLEPTEALLALDIPVIVGMGEADEAMPVETAWLLRDRFRAERKTNLTLLTYPGADHALFDASEHQSRMPEFFRAFDRWLLDQDPSRRMRL